MRGNSSEVEQNFIPNFVSRNWPQGLIPSEENLGNILQNLQADQELDELNDSNSFLTLAINSAVKTLEHSEVDPDWFLQGEGHPLPEQGGQVFGALRESGNFLTPFLPYITLISLFCLTDGAAWIFTLISLFLPTLWQVFTLEHVTTG